MSKGYEACNYCSQKGQLKFCDVCTSSDRNRLMDKRIESDDDGDFLTSAVIGAVTGSTIIGAVLGGDMLGSFIGDSLFGDDD